MIRSRDQTFSAKDTSSTCAPRVNVPAFLVALGFLVSLPSSCALAAVRQTAKPLSASTSTSTRRPVQQVDPTEYIPEKNCASWTDELLSGYEEEVDEFMTLQKAVGSEIVDSELMDQIDKASVSPNSFLDMHAQDASYVEKVAMSSIPQQLPAPAIAALSRETKRRKTPKQKGTLNKSAARVSPEEELSLARTIQQGVALHNLKTKFESEHGREITRQEWTKLAGLKSSKELRRQVSDYRSAKQALVAANMGLVHAVVARLPRNGVSYDEMLQEGSLGLLRAAELFDPHRGLRFSTYATIWIKGVLSNSKAKEPIALPMREKARWNKVRQANADLASELNRQPTNEEIAERVGLTAEEVAVLSHRMGNAQRVLSLDYEYSMQSRGGISDGSTNSLQLDKAFMADADLAERTQFHADVVAALAKNLDAREARLMRLRYGLADGRTRSIQECADAMGLSKTRVQQLAQSCLKKLREASGAESLQEYLLTIA